MTLFVDSIETKRREEERGPVLEEDAGGDLSTVRTQWARPNLDEIEGVDQPRSLCRTTAALLGSLILEAAGSRAIPNPNVEDLLVAIVAVRASTCRSQGKTPFCG